MKKKLLALLLSAAMVLTPGAGIDVIASDVPAEVLTETDLESETSGDDIIDGQDDGSDDVIGDNTGDGSGETNTDLGGDNGENLGGDTGENDDGQSGDGEGNDDGSTVVDPGDGNDGDNTDVDPGEGDDDGITGVDSGDDGVTDDPDDQDDGTDELPDDGSEIVPDDTVDEETTEVTDETTEEVEEEDLPLDVQADFWEYATISEGYYRLVTVKANGNAITVPNSTVAEEVELTVNDPSDVTATTFKIIPLGENVYEILSFASNMALTTPPENTGRIKQYAYTGVDSQKWYILKNKEADYYYIAPKTDESKAISLVSKTAKSGSKLQIGDLQDQEIFRWKLESASNPTISLNSRYVLRNAGNTGVALETYQGKTAAGANVQTGTYGPYNRQSYVFESAGYGNIFKIKNSGTERYLAVDGTNVNQSSTGSDFRVVKTDGGYFFVEVASGKYLDVEGGVAKNGKNAVVAAKSSSNTQKWTLKVNKASVGKDVSGEDAALANGYYRINLTDNTDCRMAVKNAGISEGLNVQIDTTYATDGEQWYIESLGGGLYKIKAFCSNKVLTVAYDTVEYKMNISQKEYTGSATQKWYIRKSTVEEGAFVLCSADDPNYVIGTYGEASDASNVRIYVSNKGAHQRWAIKAITSPEENALANGTYYFSSRLTYKRVMSVAEESTSDGANVEVDLKRDTKGERWTVKSLGYGNLYKVTNKNSGYSLAAKSKSAGANVLQEKYSASDETMMWRILPVKSGSTIYYRIVNVSNNQAVQCKGNKKAAGTNILLADQANSKGQLWEAQTVTNTPPKYTFICLYPVDDNSLYVSMITGNNGNNKRFVVNEASKTDNTKTFYIVPVSRDSYSIKSIGTGKYLSVYNSKTTNGAAIVQDEWRNLDSQKWKIEENGSGFRFVNVASGKYLTVKNASYNSGTYMVQQSARSDNAQTFNATTSSPVSNGWVTINGERGYVQKGIIQTDKFIDDGKYYIDKNGYLLTGWAKNGKYYFYYNGTNGKVNDARPYLNDLFGTKKSKYGGYTCPNCEYYIVVDVAYPCLATVYTSYPGTSDHNLPVFSWLVSPGTTSTPTDPGSRRTGGNQRWKSLMGPSWGQYSTEALLYTYPPGTHGEAGYAWVCNGEYFHSVACTNANTYNLNPGTYNLLGTRQSHGCIRCPVRYSYWVYEYVTYGSGLYVGSDCARPLPHVPIPYAIGRIDPTDPNYTGNWGYTDSNSYVSGYWSGYINR